MKCSIYSCFLGPTLKLILANTFLLAMLHFYYTLHSFNFEYAIKSCILKVNYVITKLFNCIANGYSIGLQQTLSANTYTYIFTKTYILKHILPAMHTFTAEFRWRFEYLFDVSHRLLFHATAAYEPKEN